MINWMLLIVALIANVIFGGDLFVQAQKTNSKNFFAFGGSVKWQGSDASVKQLVSQLKIHVHSLPDETLRQIVQVLPNGAYSVIVSDKGRYRIHLAAPHGWNFSPADDYKIDLNEDSHTEKTNYVFSFTGFNITGQAVTTGMTTGPPGLIVSALSGDSVVSQSQTTADGSFTLSVPPGKYLITVGDSASTGRKDSALASTSITVSTGSNQLADPLILQGHSLRSRITFDGQGVASISILLLIPKSSKLTKADVEQFGCSKLSGSLKNYIPTNLRDKVNLDLACQTSSDLDGTFVFSRLAGGEYFLVAYHDPALMKFGEVKSKHLSIDPAYLSVTMGHVDRQIDPGFQVTSFRVDGGAVRQPSGAPIINAEVFVNGKSVTRSNSNGAFELDISLPGDYKIHVEAPRLKFKNVNLNLTAATETLPPFLPSEIEVCARFLLASSMKPGTFVPPVEVVLESSIKTAVSEGSQSTRFCLYLPPMKHTLRLAESPNFIRFIPASVDIDLSSGPVNDITFTQFQAALTGEVICADGCPISQLAVRLFSDGQLDTPLSMVKVQTDTHDNNRATFSLVSVTPGTYNLELILLDGDAMKSLSGWCWASPGLLRLVTVVDRDLHESPELTFRHIGYRLLIEAPLLDTGFKKPVNVKVTPSVMVNGSLMSRQPIFYRLTKPINSICLSPGTSFAFEASAPCLHLTIRAPNIIQPIASNMPLSPPLKNIVISVLEIPVRAIVIALSEVNGEKLPDLTIQAQMSNSTKTVAAVWTKEGKFYTAQMNLWAAPNKEVIFHAFPSMPPSDDDTIHPLIFPVSQTLVIPIAHHLSQSSYDGPELTASDAPSSKMDEADCSDVLADAFGGVDHLTAAFSMKPGLFITGTVSPAVDKALVTVYADGSVVTTHPLEIPADMLALFSEQQLNALSPKPGLALIGRTTTNSQGLFRAGPFYLERNSALSVPLSSLLTLYLQKPGFEFALNSSAAWPTFSSQKLALVEVRVVFEDGMNPLPDTLVSIIGSVFRDSKTTDSNGIVRYVGLPAGEYYIQPMLKEFEFFVRNDGQGRLEVPMEHALSVLDGESLNVNLIGRRVAYSIFGEVTSLTGDPEVDVIVQAKLLSLADMKALGNRSIFPSQDGADVACRVHTSDAGLVVPVEQSATDDHGQFKLLELLPGCPYLVTATSKGNTNVLQMRHVFPSSIIVKPLHNDVHKLHFYLKPRVSFGFISATVDTDDKYLPDLSIVVHPVSRPDTPLIRHSFASRSRFFALLRDQIEPLIGGTYAILLESKSAHTFGKSKTIQTFTFTVDENSFQNHQHFNFAYRPGLHATLA